MIELLFVIIIASLLGILAGLLPGLGNSLILLSLYPVLLVWPPELSILFYSVLIQTSNFSSSVASINFGVLGDITGEPALRERKFLIESRATKVALQYSAIGSTVAAVLSLMCFYWFMDIISSSPVVLRTDTRFFAVWGVFVAILFWPKNAIYTNVVLVIFGSTLAMIGYHPYLWGESEVHFLTFNYPWLYGGIPSIAVLSSLIAIPQLITLMRSKFNFSSYESSSISSSRFNLKASLRGSAIGSILGMIPMVGSAMSSNVAWAVERKLSKDTVDGSLSRVLAAESANNSASITVLIPLLVLGLAIIPSEMILVSALETSSWVPGSHSWKVLGIGLLGWIYIGIVISIAISYLLCYTFVSSFSNLLKNHFKLISYFSILLIVSSITYIGMINYHTQIYLVSFLLLSLLSITLKKVDFLPAVAGFLLADQAIETAYVMLSLYQ